MKPYLVAPIGAGVLLFLANAATAAVTIVVQRVGGNSETIIYADGDHVRIDHPGRSERASATILDAVARKVVLLNDKDRTYTELTEADRQRLRQRMTEFRSQMSERLKSLPPAERQKVEEMMAKKGVSAPPGEAPAAREHDTRFEPLPDKKTVNGFACQMYRRLEDGKLREEICVAPWSAALVQKSDFAAIQKFANSVADEFGGGRRSRQGLLVDLDKFPGVPITRVPVDADGKRGEEEQIKSIKRGPIAPAKFAPPNGYAKKDVMERPAGRAAVE
jgi:hypothetical protein